jgi:hypothetical protein
MGNKCLGCTKQAPTPSPQIKRFPNGTRSNLEDDDPVQNHPILVLLDKDPQRQSTLRDRLESTNSRIITFDQVTQCQTHIEYSIHDRFILIVENEIGSIIVPEIDDLPHLLAVFVYSVALNPKKQWIQQCKTKVGI